MDEAPAEAVTATAKAIEDATTQRRRPMTPGRAMRRSKLFLWPAGTLAGAAIVLNVLRALGLRHSDGLMEQGLGMASLLFCIVSVRHSGWLDGWWHGWWHGWVNGYRLADHLRRHTAQTEPTREGQRDGSGD